VDILRKGFRDVARGYSSGDILNRRVFIKHLSHADQIEQDSKREEFFQLAKSKGALTVEEKLAILKKQGLWSDAKERELQDMRLMIEGMIEGKRLNAKMPSMVRDYARKIEEEEKKYNALLNEKLRLLGLTCEAYADREITDYYILTNLFDDEKLTRPCFNTDELDYMDETDISAIIRDYNKAIEPCSEKNLKKIAMQGFFQSYFSLVGDNLRDFFGKPVCELTFFQVNLLRNAARFRFIYTTQDTSKWPKDVQQDPDLFLDYAETVSKAKEDAKEQGSYDEGSVNIGAKKEDADALGIKVKNNLAADVMNKSGGNLIEHLMKMAG
jgi:hypothetical protein